MFNRDGNDNAKFNREWNVSLKMGEYENEYLAYKELSLH